MKPSHGQLLALYFLLVSDSDLSVELKRSTCAGDLADRFRKYLDDLSLTPAIKLPASIRDLYDGSVQRKISQNHKAIRKALGLAAYSGGSGPCPLGYEEAVILSSLHSHMPYPEGIQPTVAMVEEEGTGDKDSES